MWNFFKQVLKRKRRDFINLRQKKLYSSNLGLFLKKQICLLYMRKKYNALFPLLPCSLRISFKWMVRAFSGYLATDQLLLLWDRILGYNSLEILAGKNYLLFRLFIYSSAISAHSALHRVKEQGPVLKEMQ